MSSHESCKPFCDFKVVAVGTDIVLMRCSKCHTFRNGCPKCNDRMRYMAPDYKEMHCVGCTHQTNFENKPPDSQLALI